MAFEPIAYDTPTEDELVWEIDVQWEVFGADNRRIGVVRDVQPYHLVVRNGRFRAEELIVPVTCITDVRHESVYLSLTKADLEAQQAELAAAGGTGNADTLVREAYDPEKTIQLSVPSDLGPSPAVAETPAGSRSGAPPEVVRRLVADAPTRPAPVAPPAAPAAPAQPAPPQPSTTVNAQVDAGMDAADLRVERRPVVSRDRDQSAVDHPFTELEIFIPIRGEEPVVAKRPVVREVVEISKVLHERGQRAANPVRRERLTAEPDRVIPFPVASAPQEAATP